MKKILIKDIDVNRKKVIVRVDFNVSMNAKLSITDDTRIVEALPTIRYLLGSHAKVTLISHLGRPNGKVDPRYSLKPVAKRLQELLGTNVSLIEKYWEKSAHQQVDALKNGDIAMLENIRFHKGEEENNRQFAKHLSGFGEIFVNDAFGTSHRAHASVVGIAEILPTYAGFLISKEIEMISMALKKPNRPFLVIIGGAKTPEKIRVIERLLDQADTIMLGGAIANTFLNAWGIDTGKSLVDHEMVEMAKVVFWKASHRHSALILPEDVVVSDTKRLAKPQILPYDKVSKNMSIYDIGPKTRKKYRDIIEAAGTVIWNGPMGLYEDNRFRRGTDEVIDAITKCKGLTLVGGGDTLASIDKTSLVKNVSHLSTGGGALLEFLEYGDLPGLEVIKNA